MKSMDAAIEDGYPKAPEIVALCEVGQPCRYRIEETTLIGDPLHPFEMVIRVSKTYMA